ncbi:MAG: gliding motility lipoprotein GldH [Prevotellaceae bacterium]|nr:gliding motility lipoprotein GldH [Prevotellaceae bacterium]
MATLLSCQDSLFYSEYKEIPNSQWDSRDTLSFCLPVTENSFDATLTVSVRRRQDYDYKTIALKIEHLLNDTIVSTDTLVVTLFDANGHPLGQGFPISDNYSRPLYLHLKKNASHSLRITHAMRLNPLQGIPDVGVFVERK